MYVLRVSKGIYPSFSKIFQSIFSRVQQQCLFFFSLIQVLCKAFLSIIWEYNQLSYQYSLADEKTSFLYISCVDQDSKDATQITSVEDPTWSLHTLACLENPAFVFGPFKQLCIEVHPLLLFLFLLIKGTVDITLFGVWFLHLNRMRVNNCTFRMRRSWENTFAVLACYS